MPHLHTLFTRKPDGSISNSCPPKVFEFALVAEDTRYFGSDAWYTTEHFETYMMDAQAAFKSTNYKVSSLTDQAAFRLLSQIAARRVRNSIASAEGTRHPNVWTVEGPSNVLKFVPSDLAKDDSAFVQKLRAAGFGTTTACPLNPK